jgi:hypothetical protein
MHLDAEQHVLYQIGNAPVRRHPYPHFFIRNIFPEDYFRTLREQLPPLDWLQPIADTGSVRMLDDNPTAEAKPYAGRYIAELAQLEEQEESAGKGTFWLQLSEWLASDRLRSLLLEKFQPDIMRRFGRDAALGTDIDTRLVRDFTDYSLGPHTDSPNKLVSLLFYLPADAATSRWGTSIYAHSDPAFRCEGKLHHPFDGFKKVATMPFVPNALFAFFKTDYSFHGVDHVDEAGVRRDLLLYNLYVRAVRNKPPRSFVWPWRKRAGWRVYKPDIYKP